MAFKIFIWLSWVLVAESLLSCEDSSCDMGLVSLQHVGLSSLIRVWTCISCIAKSGFLWGHRGSSYDKYVNVFTLTSTAHSSFPITLPGLNILFYFCQYNRWEMINSFEGKGLQAKTNYNKHQMLIVMIAVHWFQRIIYCMFCYSVWLANRSLQTQITIKNRKSKIHLKPHHIAHHFCSP